MIRLIFFLLIKSSGEKNILLPSNIFFRNIIQFFLVVFFLMISPVYVQGQNYEIRHTTTFSNNESNKLKKKLLFDDDGFLWYTTYNGIVKDFEKNYAFLPFNKEGEGFPVRTVDVVFQDSKGNVWIGSDQGVFLLEPKTGKIERLDSHFSIDVDNIRLTSFIEDCKGNIWAATSQNLVLKIPPSFKVETYTIKNGYIENVENVFHARNFLYIEQIIECKKIVFRQQRKLFVLENDEIILKEDFTASKNYGSSVHHFPEWAFNGGDGMLIVDGKSSFAGKAKKVEEYSFDNKTYKTHAVEGLGLNVINVPFQEMISIHQDGNPIQKKYGDLISISSDREKLRFYKFTEIEGKTHLIQSLEIPFPYAIDDLVVIGDIIYVSNYDRISKIRFKESDFTKALHDIKPNVSMRGFMELPDDELLAASYSGIFKLKLEKQENGNHFYRSKNVFPSLNYVWSFLQLTDSTAWCLGENKTISKINFKNNTIDYQYEFKEHWRSTYLHYYDLVKHTDSTFLIASNFGLMEYNFKSNSIAEVPMLPVKNNKKVYVRDLFVTDDKLYIATDRNGLFVKHRHSQKVEQISKDKGGFFKLKSNRIYTLLVDSMENLWIGTDRGAICLDKGFEKITEIGIPEGLLDSNILGIQEDFLGNIWLSTYRGLYKYEKNTKKIVSFFEEDGLACNELQENSYYKSSKNKLFFGGVKGMVTFDTVGGARSNKTIIAPVEFEYYDSAKNKEVKVNFLDGKENSFRLPYNKNSFSISYSVNDCFNTSYNRYMYKLDGLSEDWIGLGSQNTLKLLSISPGDYTLRVKGFDSAGIESTNELSYKLHVAQIFYKRPWVQILTVLLMIGLLILFMYRSFEKTRKKYALNLTLIELERKTLISQMNPHFIFNALNEIRNRLRSGKIKGLDHYVTLFSKLSRLTLDVTRNERIKLSKEIDFIKSYVDLSNIDNDSDVVLTVEYGSDIDVDKMVIPPMLLQPIIENSIVHGFDKNQACKSIVLNIEKSSVTEQLIITIEDNGLGIDASKNRTRNSQHQSYASQILRERLNLMNQINKNGKYEMSFKDLAEEQGNGTRVIIKIPYIL